MEITDSYREKISRSIGALSSMEGALTGEAMDKHCPLEHSFGDGCYVRKIFMPAGTYIISKIHKITHPYFVMCGSALVATEDGVNIIEGPYQGMTPAGTQRALYILSDMVWITVHVTNETDLDKIEEEIIAKDFDEVDQTLIEKLNKSIEEVL